MPEKSAASYAEFVRRDCRVNRLQRDDYAYERFPDKILRDIPYPNLFDGPFPADSASPR